MGYVGRPGDPQRRRSIPEYGTPPRGARAAGAPQGHLSGGPLEVLSDGKPAVSSKGRLDTLERSLEGARRPGARAGAKPPGGARAAGSAPGDARAAASQQRALSKAGGCLGKLGTSPGEGAPPGRAGRSPPASARGGGRREAAIHARFSYQIFGDPIRSTAIDI